MAVTQIEITDEVLAKYDRLPIGRVKEDTRITIDKSKGNSGKAGRRVTPNQKLFRGSSMDNEYLYEDELPEVQYGEDGDVELLRKEMASRELARRSFRHYLYYVHGAQWKRTRMSDFLADKVQEFVLGGGVVLRRGDCA